MNIPSKCGMEFNSPACWRILREGKMRSIFVIIANVFHHQPLQMALVKNDHLIEQVASAASHSTLGHTVLPRAAIGRS